MKDLFGNPIETVSKYSLFHDESICNKSNFLYHGYLFVQNNTGREVLDEIKCIKKKHGREDREIHFQELSAHSQSSFGSKTIIALEWLNSTIQYLEKGKIRFYCFGINRNNLNNFWSNEYDYDKNVYLRFFEIGLKSAIRWFGLNKITNCFLDSGKYDIEKQKRIKWLNIDFFKQNLSHEIDINNIQIISSDENESKTEFSNLIQLTDNLLGVLRSSFIQLGDNQKGQKECVKIFDNVVCRFNNKKNAFNTNSRFWKKYSLQFFPSANNLTKEEFLSHKAEDIIKRGDFYVDRKTYKQQLAEDQIIKLF